MKHVYFFGMLVMWLLTIPFGIVGWLCGLVTGASNVGMAKLRCRRDWETERVLREKLRERMQARRDQRLDEFLQRIRVSRRPVKNSSLGILLLLWLSAAAVMGLSFVENALAGAASPAVSALVPKDVTNATKGTDRTYYATVVAQYSTTGPTSPPAKEVSTTNAAARLAWDGVADRQYTVLVGTNSGKYSRALFVGTNATSGLAAPPLKNVVVTVGGIMETSKDLKTWGKAWDLPSVSFTNPGGGIFYRPVGRVDWRAQ